MTDRPDAAGIIGVEADPGGLVTLVVGTNTKLYTVMMFPEDARTVVEMLVDGIRDAESERGPFGAHPSHRFVVEWDGDNQECKYCGCRPYTDEGAQPCPD